MRILCLDQSSYCGWCHGTPGDSAKPIYGTRRLPKARLGAKLDSFESWLREMISANGIGKVYFEKPIMPKATSIDACFSLFGVASQIAIACHREGIECVAVDMSTWRSEFGVPTQAPKRIPQAYRRKWVKAQTIARCRALGFDPQDNDAADAIGLWSCVAQRILAKEAAPSFDFTASTAL